MKRSAIVFAVALLGAAGCDSAGSRQIFLDWDINSCLGLPGGPSNERSSSRKLGVRSTEEIEILENAERIACAEFLKIQALYLEGARGGEAERYAAAGYALACDQARLGWAKGDANETVACLDQAEKFADQWLEAMTAAYREETASQDQLIAASDARWRSKIVRLRVRSALKELGVETNYLPTKFDLKKPRDDNGRLNAD